MIGLSVILPSTLTRKQRLFWLQQMRRDAWRRSQWCLWPYTCSSVSTWLLFLFLNVASLGCFLKTRFLSFILFSCSFYLPCLRGQKLQRWLRLMSSCFVSRHSCLGVTMALKALHFEGTWSFPIRMWTTIQYSTEFLLRRKKMCPSSSLCKDISSFAHPAGPCTGWS